ncbi:MAG: 2,3-bisphosphoglycerate-independent phosphoglycerate mutase [Desulfomonile tiedjei]|nr:2,3-bisphosphoglycerate-independent phosphoglycerate mutase [Desulfomonile tiedjei]
MPSRCVVILLDGLGDRSFPELGFMTPLQAAETPTLDSLAAVGANGLFHADKVGTAFSSQDAHFSLFGYDWRDMPRRSILEALGSGMNVESEDVAALARLVTANEDMGKLVIVDRVPDATPEEIKALMAEVATFASRGIEFHFTQTKQVEGILVMRGRVSPQITDMDPMFSGLPAAEIKPLKTEADTNTAAITAHALKDYLVWVYKSLNKHPINKARAKRGQGPLNALVTHLADKPKAVTPFSRRWGLKGLLISSKLVQWGLGKVLGMEVRRVKSSDDPGRDLKERIVLAAENLHDYEFIHVHTMAPDEAAHTKSPTAKVRAIEALDRAIGESIQPILDNPDVLLVVTSDHSTPSSGPLIHSGEPVPLTMVGANARRDNVRSFNEIDCSSGSLGLLRGTEFMYMVLNHLDRINLVRIKHNPDDEICSTGEYEPFALS